MSWRNQEKEMRWLGDKTRYMLTNFVPSAIEEELWLTREQFDKKTNLELYFLNRKYMFRRWFKWCSKLWFYLDGVM